MIEFDVLCGRGSVLTLVVTLLTCAILLVAGLLVGRILPRWLFVALMISRAYNVAIDAYDLTGSYEVAVGVSIVSYLLPKSSFVAMSLWRWWLNEGCAVLWPSLLLLN
jgi:hypothetical protein